MAQTYLVQKIPDLGASGQQNPTGQGQQVHLFYDLERATWLRMFHIKEAFTPCASFSAIAGRVRRRPGGSFTPCASFSATAECDPTHEKANTLRTQVQRFSEPRL